MGNESGTWIMHGLSPRDPNCIKSVEKMIDYINAVGFLPLFANDIPRLFRGGAYGDPVLVVR